MRRHAAKLATFIRLAPAEQALAVFALVLIGAASAAIALLPFRRYSRLLGRALGAVGYAPLADARALRRAILVRRAVGRAATVAPFRSNCLPQAMAAAVLARMLRFPLAVHLGVALDDGMKAHAWSNAGPVMVSGGYGFARYAVVSCFSVDPRGPRSRAATSSSPARSQTKRAFSNPPPIP